MEQLELFPELAIQPTPRYKRKSKNVNEKWVKGRIENGPREEGLNVLHLLRLGVPLEQISEDLYTWPSTILAGVDRVLKAQYVKAMKDCYGAEFW